jgi:hypothetical protein
MNRHLYGAIHGMSLHTFEQRHRTLDEGIAVSGFVKLLIIDDELLLLSVSKLSHLRAEKIRNYLSRWHNFIACEHISLGEPYEWDTSRTQLPELAKNNETPGGFTPCKPSFGSCPICLTDYCIEITPSRGWNCFSIKVAVYRQLGDGRSPVDWKWRNAVGLYALNRIRYKETYRPGCVIDRWNKGGGISSTTESKWVVPSRFKQGARLDLRRPT